MGNKDLSSYKFGKYEILEELGRGGFGIVYHAFDTVLEVERAVKELYPNLVNDPTFVSRFRQEARVAARLDHPNLVPVHDFGQIDGKYYLAMGYMAGGSLKDLLRLEGKLEPKRAYEVLAQVCEGLEYAHARGIVHRDLKPGNILFDETDKARMADMGFAKVMSEGASRSMSASGSLVGTPTYMAPETWRNKPATPQTDIYSLGCILYEMLTGKVMFEGDSPAEVMTKHVVDGPQYVADLPHDLRSVLDKALKREPDERYPDAKELLADFKAELRAEEKETVSNSLEVKPTPINQLKSKAETEAQIDTKIEAVKPVFPTAEPRVESRDIGLLSLVYEKKTYSKNAVPKKQNQFNEIKSTILIGLLGSVIIIGLVLLSLWIASTQKRHYIPAGTAIPKAPTTIQATEVIVAQKTQKATETKIATATATATNTIHPTRTQTPTQTREPGWTVINASNYDQVEQLVLVRHTVGVTSVAWSPDGKMLATGDKEGNIIIWDAASGEKLSLLDTPDFWVESLAWSPDGKRLALASDYAILLWDISSGEKTQTLNENLPYSSGRSFVVWSPNGEWLVSTSSSNTFDVWNAEIWKGFRTLGGFTKLVRSIAWSPDGKVLASGDEDGFIILWDAESGERLQTLEGHTDFVECISWSPDGRILASGSGDNTINLWDLETSKIRRTLRGHTQPVSQVAWSQNGEILASGSYDNTIIFWNDDRGHRRVTSSLVRDIAWSPDGKRLASGCDDGTIRLWGIP